MINGGFFRLRVVTNRTGQIPENNCRNSVWDVLLCMELLAFVQKSGAGQMSNDECDHSTNCTVMDMKQPEGCNCPRFPCQAQSAQAHLHCEVHHVSLDLCKSFLCLAQGRTVVARGASGSGRTWGANREHEKGASSVSSRRNRPTAPHPELSTVLEGTAAETVGQQFPVLGSTVVLGSLGSPLVCPKIDGNR